MNKKYILILALVAVASASTLNMTEDSEEEEPLNEIVEDSIDELEDEEEAPMIANPLYDIRYMKALDAHINKVIESNFRNQPGEVLL